MQEISIQEIFSDEKPLMCKNQEKQSLLMKQFTVKTYLHVYPEKKKGWQKKATETLIDWT